MEDAISEIQIEEAVEKLVPLLGDVDCAHRDGDRCNAESCGGQAI